jgi:hypothetical protein
MPRNRIDDFMPRRPYNADMGGQPAPPKQPDTRERTEGLLDLFADGAWFRFPKALLRATSKHGFGPALMLAYLLNVRFNARKHGRLHNGWFTCKTATLENNLNMSRQKQNYYLKRLHETGLVSYKRSGSFARRHVKIHAEALLRLLDGV